MNSDAMIKRLNEIRDIPTLPIIAIEINRMLDRDDTTIETLSHEIEKDPSIASKVLRLVNSPFFGVRFKVTTIRDGVVLLGFDSVRNIVVSLSLVKAFSGVLSQHGFNITQFWGHSIAVAMTSKKLSELARIGEPECCFTAGLLHDIGKIILSQYFSEMFESIMVKSINENISYIESEKSFTLFGHDKAGGFLAEKWKLPLHLVDVIRFHHSLSPRSSNINLVKIVHASDSIVKTLSLSANFIDEKANEKLAASMNQSVLKDQTLSPHLKQAVNWYPELAANIKEACLFFTKGK